MRASQRAIWPTSALNSFSHRSREQNGMMMEDTEDWRDQERQAQSGGGTTWWCMMSERKIKRCDRQRADGEKITVISNKDWRTFFFYFFALLCLFELFMCSSAWVLVIPLVQTVSLKEQLQVRKNRLCYFLSWHHELSGKDDNGWYHTYRLFSQQASTNNNTIIINVKRMQIQIKMKKKILRVGKC